MDQIYISMNEKGKNNAIILKSIIKINNIMEREEYKGENCVYQEENNNMIRNCYRAYNINNMRLCYVGF